jgi:Flp pilus assembly protein TadB
VLAAALVVAGQDGVGVPLALAVVVLTVPERRRAARAERVAARLGRDLPRAADLLATCLEAGAAPADALLLVCDAVGGPVRAELQPLAAALRAGADPAAAWAATRGHEARWDDPVLRLGRAFSRAASTGAPLADTVAAVAQDERERARWSAEAAARRAGVRAVGPLGLCFLPAFALLGVVPVVVGVAGEVLGGLG